MRAYQHIVSYFDVERYYMPLGVVYYLRSPTTSLFNFRYGFMHSGKSCVYVPYVNELVAIFLIDAL